MQIFPYQFQERERSNPSSLSNLPSNSKRASLQEVRTTLAHPITQRKHQKEFAQEINTINPQA
jgi:hypothetical protein